MTNSWGNFPKVHQKTQTLNWRTDNLPTSNGKMLPFGQGRSYGDVCLNDGGVVISTKRLNHFISFNPTTGILRCEAGVTLAQILEIIVPQGWFLPVTPGTKFVSVGGAIGNDVHGKNHHRAGTFGCHVRQFELLRSSGERLLCSPTQNQELFKATIGGLGLTGLITWAEIQLKSITGPLLEVETFKTRNISEFFELSDQSDKTHEYTVTWLDMSSAVGKGLFMRANHVALVAGDAPGVPRRAPRTTAKPPGRGAGAAGPAINMSFFAPSWLLSPPTIKAFNWLYYHKQLSHHSRKLTHYNPFFYPLDAIGNWNRLYGRRGFQSYQCIVPRLRQGYGGQASVIEKMLYEIHKAGLSSPLTVLKIFGDVISPGMMTFPMPGVNLLLDFPNVGRRLFVLMEKLDALTLRAGGRVNPAKDAHLSAVSFQAMYPQWQKFAHYINPAFSSSFWRRVTSKIQA